VAIVEDDNAIREVMEEVLNEAGYLCLSATSATGAVELLEHARPHLVILDIVLGGGSGWRVLDQLKSRRETAAIPVIVCTADTEALSTHQTILRERGVHCLPKPFDVDELVRLANEALA
jgi:CheY-like chemotaxis protein